MVTVGSEVRHLQNLVSARPTRPGERPRATTALRIQDSADDALLARRLAGARRWPASGLGSLPSGGPPRTPVGAWPTPSGPARPSARGGLAMAGREPFRCGLATSRGCT